MDDAIPTIKNIFFIYFLTKVSDLFIALVDKYPKPVIILSLMIFK